MGVEVAIGVCGIGATRVERWKCCVLKSSCILKEAMGNTLKFRRWDMSGFSDTRSSPLLQASKVYLESQPQSTS